MKSKITVSALGLFFSIFFSASYAVAQIPGGYNLVWQDEFNGPAGFYNASQPQWANWRERSAGVRRDAFNDASRAVSMTGTGDLRIKTFTDGAQHITGIIGTQTNGAFAGYMPTYGYFESRIKFSSQAGMWSAFWMQSPTMGNPIGSPATAGTEIDIVEHRAVTSSNTNISNQGVSNIHWDGYGVDHKSAGSGLYSLGAADAQGYRTYGMLWTPTEQKFYVNGVLKWTYTGTAISQRSEYFILSSEVEDNGWAGDIPVSGYGTYASSNAFMDVDYVRVYQIQAVPEPGTCATLVSLTGISCWMIRRRFRKTATQTL